MLHMDYMKRYAVDGLEQVQPYRADQACRTLWAAVLAQAVEDYLSEPIDVARLQYSCMGRSRRYAYGASMRNQRELMTSRVSKWLFEDPLVAAGSFLWICDALGLDQDFVRQRARAQKASPRRMRTFMTVH